jgi:hypothetical protein
MMPGARNLRPPDCDDITMATTTDLAVVRIRRRRVLGGLITSTNEQHDGPEFSHDVAIRDHDKVTEPYRAPG